MHVIFDLPAGMITASHNPVGYNGIKLCRGGAAPVGRDTGLADIRRLLDHGLPAHRGPAGTITRRDMLTGYATYLRRLVDLAGIRPLTVAVDAGNGMAGHTMPAVLGDQLLPALPLRLIPLYLGPGRRLPQPRRQPAGSHHPRRPAEDRPGNRPTSASPSTATPTAASSSTRTVTRCRRPPSSP